MATAVAAPDWADGAFAAMLEAGIGMVAHVPDAGLTTLIRRCAAEPSIRLVGLVNEAEGPGLLAGAWLGGVRGSLLLQSSGIGNLVNTLSLSVIGRFPLVMIVTMRGEWGEFNPWQVPMGQAGPAVLEAMGARVWSLGQAEESRAMLLAAYRLALESEQIVAVLVRQRLLGAKGFEQERSDGVPSSRSGSGT